MNRRQLEKLGIPGDLAHLAVAALQRALAERAISSKEIKPRLASLATNPDSFTGDPYFGPLARELVDAARPGSPAPLADVAYRTWGTEIDEASHAQMRQACSVPAARGGALMPDAHVGYGLPIGGVLALENAVIPYAVGVDIACRMKLSVLDLPTASLEKDTDRLRDALMKGTRFGVGCEYERPQSHPVMDQDWTITRITRERKDRAWKQLGTSGSGNHFVEFGLLTLESPELGLEPGQYVALLSHSGSRGAGSAVCDTYSNIARARIPRKYAEFGRLAWLEWDSEAGQEYWAAMNLMGDYAAANHDVIHRQVTRLLGAEVTAGVENHHNFAWKERHQDKELIVHRKGATPAGVGVLGVIPGSMATPAFVVRGKGEPSSFDSASHGAGRRMSRTKARETFTWRAVQNDLAKKGIQVLAAAADEVPGVYKDIHEVMRAQSDLVDIIARFDPRIVRMCGDGSRAED